MGEAVVVSGFSSSLLCADTVVCMLRTARVSLVTKPNIPKDFLLELVEKENIKQGVHLYSGL